MEPDNDKLVQGVATMVFGCLTIVMGLALVGIVVILFMVFL